MYRGSSFLLQKDYKVHTPIVEEILKPEYDCLFGLACADLRESEVQMMLTTVYDYIAAYFRPMRDEAAGRAVASPVSPVLITKILMGTLGCVPAYDRFFQDGVATCRVTTREYSLKSVLSLADFYEEHNDRLAEARKDFEGDGLTYLQMKLLDMGFGRLVTTRRARSLRSCEDTPARCVQTGLRPRIRDTVLPLYETGRRISRHMTAAVRFSGLTPLVSH